MVSLALFLTFFIMSPTLKAAYDMGVQPLIANEIDEIQAFDRTTAPFKDFMIKNVREADLKLFIDLSKEGPYETATVVPPKSRCHSAL